MSASSLTPAEITRRSGSNFALSFAFLARERRRGISAIYAYCREIDDAVDEAPDPARGRERLEVWRAELGRVLDATGEAPQTATGVALAATVRKFGVPPQHLRAVMRGVEMDLEHAGFADLASLEEYCSLVASAVGLACLPVFGVAETVAGTYADRLGKALQLTNILRDLRTDALEGRCYAPRDLCQAAGVDRAWFDGAGPAAAYADGGPIHRLVDSIAAIARQRFAEAAAALPVAAAVRRRLLAAEMMGAVYARLLDLVERRRGRIDGAERLRLSKPTKVMLALRTWWRGRRP